MNRFCPKCKSLLKTQKRTKPLRKRYCTNCGYREYFSSCIPVPRQKEKFSLVEEPKEIAKKEKSTGKIEIKDIKEDKNFKGKLSLEQKLELERYNQSIREVRKKKSIERILKKLRKSKYSGLKGEKIRLGGEVYEV